MNDEQNWAKNLGEALGIKSLGATKEDLDKLHQAADKHREKIKAEAEEEKVRLDEMKSNLTKTGEQFGKLIKEMKVNEHRTVPISDHRCLTVCKSQVYLEKGLLMAVTKQPKINLAGMGYTTNTGDKIFSDIDEWQIVSFRDGLPETGYYWDKSALKKHDAYWDNAVKVRLGNFDNYPNDQVRQSFSDKSKLLSIPESMLAK